MAKKKARTKRKVAEKVAPGKSCECHGEMFLMKLSVIAFVLFLLAVWPALHDVLMKVHWGWYLAAMIIFSFGAMKKHCM